MSDINTNATVTLTVNGKQAQDMLDNLKKKSLDLEKAIENAANGVIEIIENGVKSAMNKYN